MSDLTDAPEIFMALHDWFDSQNIDTSDRAYLCAVAAGFYLGIIAKQSGKPDLPTGIAILQKELNWGATGMFEQMQRWRKDK